VRPFASASKTIQKNQQKIFILIILINLSTIKSFDSSYFLLIWYLICLFCLWEVKNSHQDWQNLFFNGWTTAIEWSATITSTDSKYTLHIFTLKRSSKECEYIKQRFWLRPLSFQGVVSKVLRWHEIENWFYTPENTWKLRWKRSNRLILFSERSNQSVDWTVLAWLMIGGSFWESYWWKRCDNQTSASCFEVRFVWRLSPTAVQYYLGPKIWNLMLIRDNLVVFYSC